MQATGLRSVFHALSKGKFMSSRIDSRKIAPQGMQALFGVHTYLHQHTDLPKPLIDLVFLRTSQINGCAHCIDMHSRDLIKEGMSVEKLVLVPTWREAESLFSDIERAALAWTECVVNVSTTHIPDADYEAALAAIPEKATG
jgi:AhpD family alkylhydroperoxidase